MKYPVMVEIYASWVFAGRKELNDVPANIRNDVKKRVEELEKESKEVN